MCEHADGVVPDLVVLCAVTNSSDSLSVCLFGQARVSSGRPEKRSDDNFSRSRGSPCYFKRTRVVLV